jgi:hypothetical protein
MSVSVSIPQTVRIRRSRLVGLIGGAAAVAAAVTWAVLAFGVDIGGGQTQVSVSEQPAVVSSPIPMTGYLDGITSHPSVVAGTASPVEQHPRSIHSVMDLTPGDFTAGALWGYALPSVQRGPNTEQVLASLSPESRRYVEGLMGLTFRQLAAGAAGSP